MSRLVGRVDLSGAGEESGRFYDAPNNRCGCPGQVGRDVGGQLTRSFLPVKPKVCHHPKPLRAGSDDTEGGPVTSRSPRPVAFGDGAPPMSEPSSTFSLGSSPTRSWNSVARGGFDAGRRGEGRGLRTDGLGWRCVEEQIWDRQPRRRPSCSPSSPNLPNPPAYRGAYRGAYPWAYRGASHDAPTPR